MLPGFPETDKWLSDEQRQIQLGRMKLSAGQEAMGEDQGLYKGAIAALLDWKTWVASVSILKLLM